MEKIMTKFEKGDTVWYYPGGVVEPVEFIFGYHITPGAYGEMVMLRLANKAMHLDRVYASEKDALKAQILWLQKELDFINNELLTWGRSHKDMTSCLDKIYTKLEEITDGQR